MSDDLLAALNDLLVTAAPTMRFMVIRQRDGRSLWLHAERAMRDDGDRMVIRFHDGTAHHCGHQAFGELDAGCMRELAVSEEGTGRRDGWGDLLERLSTRPVERAEDPLWRGLTRSPSGRPASAAPWHGRLS